MHLNRLGPYEIGKPLGKGGMGSVYEAIDTGTSQRVAVKALTPHLAMAEGFRERFEAEIESLKTLRHDGIVRLYGYGEQDGVLFYSMELVEGVSLEDEMRAGRRFNWREVTNIATQLCSALKHAHDHGIIHRDIKPANILLASEVDEIKVKLADFGIARLFGTTQLTTAGGVLGTADYMSPEQADGRPITARCDQYSLGGVMYALLAGRPPFRAKSLPQMLQLQRFAKPEPVRRYAPDTPDQLERVILQLLAKEPAERFPNTQVLSRHLQAMYKALSRPAADDFALAGEAAKFDPSHPDWEHSLVSVPTRADAELGAPVSSTRQLVNRGDAKRGEIAAPPEEASTLAAEEVAAVKAAKAAATQSPAGFAVTQAEAPSEPAPSRPARFTTVEDDEAARRKAEQKRSWLLVTGQLALLAALLGGMGALAVFLSRPKTADELYEAISEQANVEGDESMIEVERKVQDFLRRFPGDPRSVEVGQHEEQIALDKMERKLQLTARTSRLADSKLLPVETLYLQAVDAAEQSPEKGITMLQSLVDLYGVEIPAADLQRSVSREDLSRDYRELLERQAAVVRLAERRLAELRVDSRTQTRQQLELLHERLGTAMRIAGEEPAKAAAMYRAIIALYGEHDWADHIVAGAKRRLAELEAEP
jgi:eukaryotic-like serine/threonine-protein kinase